ncbi:uncharacterized protein LOC106154129 [Lingula anatina]|uniref:Uncharacterized protein LOC106154129 n=1 Tax=Lingula anatina TaxID=7574 RepID=A0A1S3HCX6_LINAN|nr:uncharacterized protein LOC106154129 [Lingula anatina]XP_013383841.1 uncharacterized protein LOC106154129 [Lingula anatina]XP_013383842.1 uncharacterized protein LOC106154129 [Lingula anatina]XP_013383843.1 uncharacterized protein LOC106154129 [Lingula anatina]XP_013383844.1 uncharacterized protein LOC106154129 [Lingula anatina]XP_013383847.1 uncharacterized protein LOC106154129 [Lingula anatina]XP_013383848.1 uncharacterized protein LOC106154129 [Lingula anatina]XP_013383849.1 uncharacte|eukprot:XP_013383840.1 uncharacterized protein LOC106154129 [Lingula anatina]
MASPGEEMADDIMGVAVFGTGRIGAIHFKHLMIMPDVEVLWLVEEDTQRGESLAKSHRSKARVVSPEHSEQVYADKRVSAVVVATPAATHEEIIQKSLKAGKAVFCEKPIDVSWKVVRRLYDEAEQAGKPLQCGFNRRFDPQLRHLQRRLLSGEIGKPMMAKTCSRDACPDMASAAAYSAAHGGYFLDSTVHDIDVMCWLLGEHPISVSCTVHTHDPVFMQHGDFDTIVAVLKFPSGVIGVIDQSRHAVYGHDQRVEVLGSNGMLTSENQHPSSVHHWTPEGVSGTPIVYNLHRYDSAYEEELKHFIKTAAGKESLELTGDHVVKVMQIATACRESAVRGQTIELNKLFA